MADHAVVCELPGVSDSWRALNGLGTLTNAAPASNPSVSAALSAASHTHTGGGRRERGELGREGSGRGSTVTGRSRCRPMYGALDFIL